MLLAVALVSAAVAVVALHQWFTHDPARDFTMSMPGADGRPAHIESGGGATDLSGTFQTFDGVPADLPGAWPRFRGADFDNILKAPTALADSWGPDGPRVLWSVSMGEGHAAPVVLNGRVYVLDYDEDTRADAIRCFSLDDGREIWRHSYPVSIKRNHGMSRTVPAVTGDYLVTVGPRCHVVCLNATTGGFLWGISMTEEYGTTEPLWYTGQCPMIDDDTVILAPCGPEALLVAIDCATGDPVWTTPNPQGWDMSHSSVMPMTFGGTRMYLYCATGGIAGVAADGREAGTILWQIPWDAKVIAPSPVPLDNGMIFLTAGYGKGNIMLQLRQEGGSFAVDVVFEKTPKEGLACEQQSPIYHDGLLHGIMPKDAGGLRGQFVCYRPDGTLVWSSGPDRRFGLGPFILADGKFYVLSDDGVLTVLRANREAYVQVSEAKVLDGQDAWGPIAIAGERMLMRDSTRMVCIHAGATR
ncbi:MAG: PQQ-binding-like beta-propeller repeat protein [bacterium]|nr:PQQ-binding-like beta-propeller repeat protein [bacterium]